MIDSFIPFINLEFFYYQIYRLLTGQIGLTAFYNGVVDLSVAFMPYATVISLVILVGIFYCVMRYRKVEHEMLLAYEGDSNGFMREEDRPNRRWIRIIDHLNSDNESDWRLAILEADLILEDMLSKMGYHGETVGDKLKGVERSDFKTIDDAWEGHRVRNMIAHEGGDFRISNRDARRVIGMYEKVFKEFHFI